MTFELKLNRPEEYNYSERVDLQDRITIEQLPTELLCRIFSNLELNSQDMAAVARVCKSWRANSSDFFVVNLKLERQTVLKYYIVPPKRHIVMVGGIKSIATMPSHKQWNIPQWLQMIALRTGQSIGMLNLLRHCPNLTVLDLSKAPLNDQELEQIGKVRFTFLQRLVLNENSAIKAPKLQGFSSLQTLQISGAKNLAALEVKNLPGLKELEISRCHIESVKIEDLKSCERLIIGGCPQLKNLTLNGLDRLEFLELCANGLLNDVDLSQLGGVKKIDLSFSSGLTRLSLRGLVSLTDLNLSQCPHLVSVERADAYALAKINLTGNQRLEIEELAEEYNITVIGRPDEQEDV